MPRVEMRSRGPRGCWSPAVAAAPTVPAPPRSADYRHLEELFGEPVTTCVIGRPQRTSEAPAALALITRDDIRRSRAGDIVGFLRTPAGIKVRF